MDVRGQPCMLVLNFLFLRQNLFVVHHCTCQTNSQAFSCLHVLSHCRSKELKDLVPCQTLYGGFRRFDLKPHGCGASALSTEPPLLPQSQGCLCCYLLI